MVGTPKMEILGTSPPSVRYSLGLMQVFVQEHHRAKGLVCQRILYKCTQSIQPPSQPYSAQIVLAADGHLDMTYSNACKKTGRQM